MNVSSTTGAAMDLAQFHATTFHATAPKPPSSNEADDAKLQETFNQFVGETMFGQALKSMRKTVGKPAYFHGGQAEEIFQQQLDQILSEKMAKASGQSFSQPMFELFQLGRR